MSFPLPPPSATNKATISESRWTCCGRRRRNLRQAQRSPKSKRDRRNRKGNFKVGMRTEKSRLRRGLVSLQELLQELMRRIRHDTISDQVDEINAVLRGHYAYYGIAGNIRALLKVYWAVERYWHRMLCSRS